ncbi:hypothetical protein [Legionella saoudiensis]|uniref:hypothetical protein n=1 Tax=Legionella saoudiensis TaxID=1750561 RepID=UPI00072FC872|nr:hypothetical protein [Legionella saoudiensis]
MFTDTQLGIYETSKDYIFTRLANLAHRSHEAGIASVKAFFFQLNVALKYNKTYTEYVGELFYPSHLNVKLFFSGLNDLLHANAPEHVFVKSITDPRFFSAENNTYEYKKKLLTEFSNKLKQDVSSWYDEEFKKTELKDSDMADLHSKYHPKFINSLASAGSQSAMSKR